MPSWFSRKSSHIHDRIDAADIARYGRVQILGYELSGEPGPLAAFDTLEPLRSALFGSETDTHAAVGELHRHASQGPWEAVGAWKFAADFVMDADTVRSLTDAGLLALDRMQITNLAIHLNGGDSDRYQELTGHPPANDGFFGPPVFDSPFGPTREFYFDRARTNAAARDPTRLSSASGVIPGPLPAPSSWFWDFGMLILRGPLLVGPDCRFEASLVHAAAAAAKDVDHALFADGIRAAINAERNDRFTGWTWIGAARFVEDYLDPALTAGPTHIALIDGGLAELEAMVGRSFPAETLSFVEFQRLDAARSAHE